IVPRAFYFIEPQGTVVGPGDDVSGRVINIRTHPLALEGAKKPWDGISLTGLMQGRYLYRTAIARNVLPFALVNPPLVALPLVKEERSQTGAGMYGNPEWQLLDSSQLTARGDLESARWFAQCEKLWSERRSDGAKKQRASLTDWLDWQKKLTEQPVDGGWAVIYTASGTDASAVGLNVSAGATRLLADHKTYIAFVASEEEARFVECFLNCGHINQAIKEFQTRGLFGPRDIHKKILELPWPTFSRNRPSHRRLVELGRQAARTVQDVLGSQQDLELDPRSLGRLRTRIRTELSTLMQQIDSLVEAISTGRDLEEQSADWQRVIHGKHKAAKGQKADELSEFLRSERSHWTERELLASGGRK
ncbi:MAG: hypothetical protein ACK5PF_06820, partial [bacterium]